MKKSICLLLLLLTLIGLNSCGYAPMSAQTGIIITDIEKCEWKNEKECWCNYYGRGDWGRVATICSDDFKFTDSCGKYQIGDTIIFTKK